MTRILLATIVGVLVATGVYAQQPQGSGLPIPLQAAQYGAYGSHASTAAEGALRGTADIVRGMGEYNYNTAAGWLIGEHARSKALDNSVQYAQAYYERRRQHDYYAAETQPAFSLKQAQKLAEWGVPDRLAPHQFNQQLGAIYWPAVLEEREFATYRTQLEALFEERGPDNSGIGSENFQEIKAVTEKMTQVLKEELSSMDPAEYIQAKKFLASMAFDARFPLEPGEEVASN